MTAGGAPVVKESVVAAAPRMVDTAEVGVQTAHEVVVCKHWVKGFCHWGDKYHFDRFSAKMEQTVKLVWYILGFEGVDTVSSVILRP